MHLSEPLVNPAEDRLRLSAQLGVQHVVLDNRGSALVSDPAGPTVRWNAKALTEHRRRVEGFGLTVDAFTLDVGSILIDSLTDLAAARKTRDTLARNVAVAADAGLTCLQYDVQLSTTTRTGSRTGRGGVKNASFRLADVGTGTDRPTLNEQAGWDAIEFLVDGLIPAADAAGVKLACRPHDPALPPGGLYGTAHVLGSAEGLRRFLALSGSRRHGLDFCQGTVAAMFTQPARVLPAVIEEFAATGRVFLVHFRNIRGGWLDFEDVFPDEGDVDMFEALRAWQRGGYRGPLCPDPSPQSELDPRHERFMAFAIGYTRGLMQAAGVHGSRT